ncbi:hypothetical protein [Actinoplanes missouriensis]|nr:hypothetical protein [Actinoplanes missouriensis]
MPTTVAALRPDTLPTPASTTTAEAEGWMERAQPAVAGPAVTA